MYSATHESLTVALGQRQENTGRVKNQLQIAGFVTVPSKRKKEQEHSEIHNINTTIWEHFGWYFLNEMNKGKPDFNSFKVFHVHDTMKNQREERDQLQ